jgi:hypothetical protein
MVAINLPPPPHPPTPLFIHLGQGDTLLRIFDPTRYHTQPLTFRHHGPLHRFDHHRHPFGQAADDPDRGIYYAAFTFSGCIIESKWGDTGVIEIKDEHICEVTLTRGLTLLDLRGTGAMRAGSVAALAKIPDRPLSQAWSRFFYEHPDLYTPIDGICYSNAHNDEGAVALYERAQSALTCSPSQVMRLDDPALRSAIQQIAKDHNMMMKP